MRDLYRKVTGDTVTDESVINAHVAKWDARKRQVAEWRAEGLTWREIGRLDGHANPATLCSFILKALWEIREDVVYG